MLESLLPVADFYWDGGSFCPPLNPGDRTAQAETLARWRGQFSLAAVQPDGQVLLARDRLGINKLFFAIHGSGTVRVSNYLADLATRGVPAEAIYSVPAGHFLVVDPVRERLTLQRYSAFQNSQPGGGSQIDEIARTIRANLDLWFSRLAAQLAGRRLCICLSGGLDSSVIAVFAARYFSDVTAYTYGYVQRGRAWSDDACAAARVAEFLDIPFRLVPASDEDLIEAVEEAVRYGQDWRDFNVHCAVVNTILARAIEEDVVRNDDRQRPLVLSGDLMNEFLADYTPVSYEGREYYRLPRLAPADLRTALVRGLDAGDREVGVFNHRGIDVIQPYGLLADDYLRLPGAFLATDRCKQDLVRAVAGDLLPSFVFERTKVRAQIGTSGEPTGILPVLARAKRDATWLRQTFCRIFGIGEESFLDRFVRLGVYRFPQAFPQRTGAAHGYLA